MATGIFEQTLKHNVSNPKCQSPLFPRSAPPAVFPFSAKGTSRLLGVAADHPGVLRDRSFSPTTHPVHQETFLALLPKYARS